MKLGTISAVIENAGLRLTIDGESSPTTKKYLFLSSYAPTVGDRVLVEEVGNSYVVLGKVVDTEATGVNYMTDFRTSGGGLQAQYADGTYSNSVYGIQADSVKNRLHDDHTYPIVFYETNNNFYIAYAGGNWHKITTS